MHIVSYRGPGMAGGVSAALARAWECNYGTNGLWWHIDKCELKVSRDAKSGADHVADIPEEVIKGHYRYCNDFLWPVMHDLPQYATVVPADRQAYETFNETIGWCLLRAQTPDSPVDYFVQDYQLTLLPQFLRNNAGLRSLIFWHIPWPKNVLPEHAPYIARIARGMLEAEAIGFHTEEYAQNFFNFVQAHLREYAGRRDTLTLWPKEQLHRSEMVNIAVPPRRRAGQSTMYSPRKMTRLVVAPLGIDSDYWETISARQDNTFWHPALVRTPFILSVDRADYTKDVVGRMKAIDVFFERNPEWIGKVVFAQISGKTRSGLQAFDQYWNECRESYYTVTNHWATEDWQPVMWLEQSFSPPELALAYRTAAAMLVNPVRDGLNLTAKEYVACQGRDPGVLILSNGAGAWHELGSHAVSTNAGEPEHIADGIARALNMDSHERLWRMAILKERVRSNTLSKWWYTFTGLLERSRVPAAAGGDVQRLRETS